MPFLSVVTPVFNRAALIGRAIESCLRQDDADWEMIIVDDGSTDDSVNAVRRFSDARIRLLRHERNRGMSPARNTGVRAAQGEWIVLLDSDDELLPGALQTVARRANEVEEDIARLAFMCQEDQGGYSPDPPLREETWTYEDYIRSWAAAGPRTDFINCIRRRTFETLPFSEDRVFDALYHLEFARQFKTRTFPEAIVMVHSDAPNRSSDYSIRALIWNAPDNARARRVLLERHGGALRNVAPPQFCRELRIAAILHFLARDRVHGSGYALRLLLEQPRLDVLALWGIGLLGARATASAMVARARVRRMTSTLRPHV